MGAHRTPTLAVPTAIPSASDYVCSGPSDCNGSKGGFTAADMLRRGGTASLDTVKDSCWEAIFTPAEAVAHSLTGTREPMGPEPCPLCPATDAGTYANGPPSPTETTTIAGTAAIGFESAAAQAAAVGLGATTAFPLHAGVAAAAVHSLETKLYGSCAGSSTAQASGSGSRRGCRDGADGAAGLSTSRSLTAEVPAGSAASWCALIAPAGLTAEGLDGDCSRKQSSGSPPPNFSGACRSWLESPRASFVQVGQRSVPVVLSVVAVSAADFVQV
jgi:hypothetical protein